MQDYINFENKHGVRIAEFFKETPPQKIFEDIVYTTADIKVYIRYRDLKENIMYLLQFKNEESCFKILKIKSYNSITPSLVKDNIYNPLANGCVLDLFLSDKKTKNCSLILKKGKKYIECYCTEDIMYHIGFSQNICIGLLNGVFKEVNGWTLFIKSTTSRKEFSDSLSVQKEALYIEYEQFLKYNELIKLNSSKYYWDQTTKQIKPKTERNKS